MRKTVCISFHLAKNTTKLKMKTMNDGTAKKSDANKPFFFWVDFLKSSDWQEVERKGLTTSLTKGVYSSFWKATLKGF